MIEPMSGDGKVVDKVPHDALFQIQTTFFDEDGKRTSVWRHGRFATLEDAKAELEPSTDRQHVRVVRVSWEPVMVKRFQKTVIEAE